MKGQVKSKAYSFTLSKLLSHTVPEISVTEAASQEDVLFLDAREVREFEVSRIQNALFVGYDNFDTATVSEIHKEQSIIVYCSVGYRSEKIAEKLLDLGFSDVSNLYGGIFEWKNQGFSVVDNKNELTENVHAYDRIWGVWLKRGKKIYK